MFIVGAAVKHHVTIGGRISGFGVVVHLIGIQDVGAVVNFRLTVQFEDGPMFFLLQGADGDVLCFIVTARKVSEVEDDDVELCDGRLSG